MDGCAAPLAYGHAGRGGCLAIWAAVQIGRLMDPSVEIGSHADDVIWAERPGVRAQIPTEGHTPPGIFFGGIALIAWRLLECAIQVACAALLLWSIFPS